MNKKREGVLFGIQDSAGNIICNIFIEIVNFEVTRGDHEELIFEMDGLLKETFFEEEIELLPVFDLEHLKGKFAYPKAQVFPVELFYDYENKFNKALFKKIILSIRGDEREYLPALTPGAVTRGRDFFNQEVFINQIWDSLKSSHIIATAPRRFGKTSILYYLLDYPQNGFIPLHIDLEGISDAPSFVCEVMIAYRRWIVKEFEGRSEQEIDEERKKLCTSLEADWQQRWEEFCRQLDKKILFLFDEFSLMLENITDKTEAHKLLALIHQTIPNLKKTRCIITGSTLIKRIIDEIGYQDKERFYSLFEKKRLPALSLKDGYEFIQILLAKIDVRPVRETVETILNLIGSPIPFFIQLFVFEIEKGLIREAEEPTPANIKRVYQERLLGPGYKSYFRHYYGHLSKYRLGFIYPLPGLKDIFEELVRDKRTADELKPIFKQRCPRASDNDFDRVMEYLEDEFYIEEIEGRYGFSSNILKDWWLRHSRYLEVGT